jgi:HlyD family secretion protein
MKPVVPIAVGVVLIIGGYHVVRILREREARNHLAFSGNIEMTEARLSFKHPGRLEERYVDEGDRIASGSLIARLDTSELESQRKRAEASVASAEARLTMLDSEIRLSEQSTAADIDSKKADLGQAKATLEELVAGSRKEEIAQAQAAVAGAKTEMEQAQRDWVRAQELYTSAATSTSERDAARSRYDTARATLDLNQQKLDLLVAGTRSERIVAAQALVDKSLAGVRGAQASEIELELKKLERPIRDADLKRARADLAIIDTQLSDSVLLAPMDGVVLTKSAEPGEVLAAGTPVLTVGDIHHPWVRAYVAEPDLGKVKLGDRVRVQSDSFPGKSYEGKISFIASEAEFTPKQIQTREERTKFVYRVKVELPNPNEELKLNMPVEGEILPGTAQQKQ